MELDKHKEAAAAFLRALDQLDPATPSAGRHTKYEVETEAITVND